MFQNKRAKKQKFLPFEECLYLIFSLKMSCIYVIHSDFCSLPIDSYLSFTLINDPFKLPLLHLSRLFSYFCGGVNHFWCFLLHFSSDYPTGYGCPCFLNLSAANGLQGGVSWVPPQLVIDYWCVPSCAILAYVAGHSLYLGSGQGKEEKENRMEHAQSFPLRRV